MADPKDNQATDSGNVYETTVKVEQTESPPADEPTTTTTETTESTETTETTETTEDE